MYQITDFYQTFYDRVRSRTIRHQIVDLWRIRSRYRTDNEHGTLSIITFNTGVRNPAKPNAVPFTEFNTFCMVSTGNSVVGTFSGSKRVTRDEKLICDENTKKKKMDLQNGTKK